MAPLFPLVVVVHADVEVRVRRLVDQRGMPEEDARARIAAQADDEQRRAVADVWLDNSGSPEELVAAGPRRVEQPDPAVRPQPERSVRSPGHRRGWCRPIRAGRTRRGASSTGLKTACGHRALRVDHIGSTAVPDFDAKDVIDIQITVESLAVADELAEPLLSAGYPRIERITADVAKADARSTVDRYDHSDDPALWRKRIHASADPGRPTNVHIRVDGWPNQQFALLFVDWLAANPDVRADYLAVKRAAEARAGGDIAAYAAAKEPWFLDAYRRAWEWADSTGWRP